MLALCAEFDQYPDEPVPKPSVTLLQNWITNYQLHETHHISLPFISTGPGTESAGPGSVKSLTRLVHFLWIVLTLESFLVRGSLLPECIDKTTNRHCDT